jgi:hypothetical protein
LDRSKTNTEIAKELNITPVLDRVQDNKRRWIHVNRMLNNRLPRLIKNTPQKIKGTKKDHGRDFWMCETGMGIKLPSPLIAP